MENNSYPSQPKSTLKYVLVIVVVLIFIGLVYFLKNSNNNPIQVLTPNNYESGTKISLYKNTPPNFPEEIILENKTLDYSGTVTTPEGKTQTKVSYKSDKSVSDILVMYKNSLSKNNWQVSVNSVTPNVANFRALKGGDSVLITIATIKQIGTGKDIGALVTFQYEK